MTVAAACAARHRRGQLTLARRGAAADFHHGKT
jgi:hypothetical protein